MTRNPTVPEPLRSIINAASPSVPKRFVNIAAMRGNLGVDDNETDTSRDADIAAMTPRERLRLRLAPWRPWLGRYLYRLGRGCRLEGR